MERPITGLQWALSIERVGESMEKSTTMCQQLWVAIKLALE